MGIKEIKEIKYIKQDNVMIPMQQILLRSEFEAYKIELKQKELEKKSNRWFVIGMIFAMAIITYLTIYHKDSSLFSYSNKDTQVYQVARLGGGLMKSGGFLSLHLMPGYHNRSNHG